MIGDLASSPGVAIASQAEEHIDHPPATRALDIAIGSTLRARRKAIGLSMKAIKYPYALISINILKANDVVYHSKDTDR